MYPKSPPYTRNNTLRKSIIDRHELGTQCFSWLAIEKSQAVEIAKQHYTAKGRYDILWHA